MKYLAMRLNAMGNFFYHKGWNVRRPLRWVCDQLFGFFVFLAHTLDPAGPWKRKGASYYYWWRKRTLLEKQQEITDMYPDEYVILRGERLFAHTRYKERAYILFALAWDEEVYIAGSKSVVPSIIPPKGIKPIIRGRGIRGRS